MTNPQFQVLKMQSDRTHRFYTKGKTVKNPEVLMMVQKLITIQQSDINGVGPIALPGLPTLIGGRTENPIMTLMPTLAMNQTLVLALFLNKFFNNNKIIILVLDSQQKVSQLPDGSLTMKEYR